MKAFDTDVLTEILLGDHTYVARAATIPPHDLWEHAIACTTTCSMRRVATQRWVRGSALEKRAAAHHAARAPPPASTATLRSP